MTFFTWFQSLSPTTDGAIRIRQLTLEKFSDHKYRIAQVWALSKDGTLIGNYKSLYIVILKMVGGVLQAAQELRNKCGPLKALLDYHARR